MLKVQQLTFHYRGQPPILQNLDFELGSGELVLIAGATGSGKSTFLNCLAGIAPTYTGGQLTGAISYADQPLTALGVKARSHWMGTVLQNVETQLFTERVATEIAFGLENRNVDPARIPAIQAQTLATFDLSAQTNQKINQLSAGQKQRLVLACVLTMDQPVLLLDEPFAFLDAASCHQLLDLLNARIALGQSMIVVEHRTELLAPFAQRIYHCRQRGLTPGLPPLGRTNPQPPTQPGSENALTVTNLGYGTYPTYPDFTLQAGERVLLQGGNGCGKTTFLRLIAGLLKPRQGQIRLFGQNTQGWSVAKVAQTVGLVLQNPNHQLFAEQVDQELYQPGVDPHHALDLLTQLNLLSQRHQHPQSLSQGQKRRLALGAVLARQPRLCLLDEITVGQDPGSLALMLEVLSNFTNGGGTLILTSHDPQVAAMLSARVFRLDSPG